MYLELKKRMGAVALAALVSLALLALGAGAAKVSTKREDRAAAEKAEQQRWSAIVVAVTASPSRGNAVVTLARENPKPILRLLAKSIR